MAHLLFESAQSMHTSPNDSALEDKLQKLAEHATDDTLCGKYYNMYKKPSLVGRLMVLW